MKLTFQKLCKKELEIYIIHLAQDIGVRIRGDMKMFI